MNSRLRVLYLTHHGPWPTISGGRRRDAALVAESAKLVDLEVWAVTRTVALDHAALSQAPDNLVLRLFPDESVLRSYPARDSTSVRASLREKISGPDVVDVVHVEGHYLFHLVPADIRHRTVVVEHNIESHVLRQRLAHQSTTAGMVRDINTVMQNEESVWSSAGLVVALSEEDRNRILSRVPDAKVVVSTDGADHIPLRLPRPRDTIARRPTFGFLANYAYAPNRDALHWLLDKLFPMLRCRIPNCRLALVGSSLDSAFGGNDCPPGVEAHGWVDDLGSFWDRIDVLLCPLRVGGGVKVKLIDALRSGTLSVSTSVGLEGFQPLVRDAILRADTPDGFVDAAVSLCTDEGLRTAQQARVAGAQTLLPSWRTVARELSDLWSEVAASALKDILAR